MATGVATARQASDTSDVVSQGGENTGDWGYVTATYLVEGRTIDAGCGFSTQSGLNSSDAIFTLAGEARGTPSGTVWAVSAGIRCVLVDPTTGDVRLKAEAAEPGSVGSAVWADQMRMGGLHVCAAATVMWSDAVVTFTSEVCQPWTP